jgi:hypothetical protein
MLSNGKQTWRRRTERVENQWFSVREDFPGPKTRDLMSCRYIFLQTVAQSSHEGKLIADGQSLSFSPAAKGNGLLDKPSTFQSGFVRL